MIMDFDRHDKFQHGQVSMRFVCPRCEGEGTVGPDEMMSFPECDNCHGEGYIAEHVPYSEFRQALRKTYRRIGEHWFALTAYGVWVVFVAAVVVGIAFVLVQSIS